MASISIKLLQGLAALLPNKEEDLKKKDISQ